MSGDPVAGSSGSTLSRERRRLEVCRLAVPQNKAEAEALPDAMWAAQLAAALARADGPSLHEKLLKLEPLFTKLGTLKDMAVFNACQAFLS